MLVIGVAAALLVGMIGMLSKKSVNPPLKPDEYRLVAFARFLGQYYGDYSGTVTSTDTLYLLEIGSPHQYFVRVNYYDWETKETALAVLEPGVKECILRYMPGNPGIFAHDLRRQSNQCYMPVKGSSNVVYEEFSDEVGKNEISNKPVVAITVFNNQSASSGVPWDSFRYLPENSIRSICDTHQVGCVWVTLEPVISQK